MIELLIFHLHIVGALYGLVKRWQEANIKEGVLAALIFGLCFTIVWALTGQIARLAMPGGGYPPWFTSDTLSLILASIPDGIFFYFFFVKDKRT